MFNLKSKWVRLSSGFAAATVLLWASGIAPQAYNLIQSNGTPATKGSTLNFNNTASVTWSCSTTGIVTSCSATSSGSGGSGGGIVTYSSGSAINPAGTQFVAIGGGGQASTTEADVEIGAPSAATISSMFVNLDLAAGTGNSIVFTWRKAGASQALTCTIAGATATTCSDTTHSFTVAQGDLIDIQMVTTGTVLVAPGLTIATAYGTTGTAGYLTVENNGTPLPQEPVLNLIDGTNTTYVCADNPGNTSTDCKVNTSGGGGSFSVNGYFLNDGTNNYIGAQQNIATLPVFGSFSWLTTQGTASVTTFKNALQMLAPGVGGNAVRCFGTPIGSNTTLTVAQSFEALPVNFISVGLGFFESATGRIEILNTQWTAGSPPGVLEIDSYINETTHTSTPFSTLGGMNNGDLRWYRLTLAGGNISYAYSTDGQHFATVYTEAANSFFATAPDNWCIAANPVNGDMATTVYSWNPQP